MNKSTTELERLLTTLSAAARQRGLSDSAWAAAAGVRKETLSRLRGRRSCDLATLQALARVVGARIEIQHSTLPSSSEDGHFPDRFNRDDEQLLLELAASGNLDSHHWRASGPAFFMAGLAVLLASIRGFDRQRLLALAEQLHPGSSQPAVFTLWLERSPLLPSRFLPQLEQGLERAA